MTTRADDARLSRVEKDALRAADDAILRRMIHEERVESEQMDTRILVRLLDYLRPHRGLALLAVVAAMIEALVATLPPLLIGMATDAITSGANTEPRGPGAVVIALVRPLALSGWFDEDVRRAWVIAFGVVAFLLWILRWTMAVTTTWLVQRLGQLVVHDLRTEVFRHITSLDMGFFHRNPVGRLVNRTTFDVAALAELFSDAFAQTFRDLLFIAVLMAMMLSLDVGLALVVICAFPLLLAAALVYRAAARPSMRTVAAIQSRMNAWLAENISGMRENQLYTLQERRRAEFRGFTDAHMAAVTQNLRAWGLLRPAMMLTTGAATTVLLFLGESRVLAGVVTVGILVTFLQYSAQLWVPVRNLAEKFNLIQNALTSGERVASILDERSSLPLPGPRARTTPVSSGTIRFDDVTFTYPGKTAPAVRDVRLDVPHGTTVALVGDTGAGKTTLAALVSRFWDVTSGRVLVDGTDVREWDLHTLRSATALVPQDVVIFAGPLRDNITLGRPIDDDTIWAALRAVRADAIVERLGGTLDAELDEAGRTLSTGERQLLSFARALVVNPAILVLDEATANVDTRTELIIQDALRALTSNRTSLVIAHRLSTVRDADLIVVMREGAIIERGTHDELMASDGEYARLYRLHLREQG